MLMSLKQIKLQGNLYLVKYNLEGIYSMKIIIAILVFGIIIAVHEFGHFIVAKRCGIKVNEFAIGMGPAIFKKQKGETLYSLRIFPVGGYCAMEGEDAESQDNRAFNNKPILQRIAVLVAGAVMNILLGFIIVVIMISTSGSLISTTIASFNETATSSNTGLKVDDQILKINGMTIFDANTDIPYKLTTDTDGIVSMRVLRDGKKVDLTNIKFAIQPATDNAKQQIIFDFKVRPEEKNVFTVLEYSIKKTASVARLIWISLVDLLKGKYGFNELSGPVGIVGVIGTAISVQETFAEKMQTIMSLAAFITINVGIFNLLPLPALDGGRIFCRLIEAVIRKRIKPEVEQIIHFVGLALLLLLMVAVTFNDVFKLFKN